MPRIKYLKSGEIAESSIQKAVIQYCRSHHFLSRVIFHIPNGVKTDKIQGKFMQSMGVMSGVSDLFIATPKKGFHGAWIELKSKDGILTPQQKLFLSEMKEQGYLTSVTHTIEDTINLINWYCF